MPKTEIIYGCKFMQEGAGCNYQGEPDPSAVVIGSMNIRTCLCITTGNLKNPGYAGNCSVGGENIVEEEVPQS